MVESDVSAGGRGVLDGGLLRRWMELGSWKRAEGVGRVGGADGVGVNGNMGGGNGEWDIRGMLEEIGGGGLEFL